MGATAGGRIVSAPLLLFIATIAILQGCAKREIKGTVDYGQFPDRYREVVAAYIPPFLVSPTSVIYSNWREPSRGFISSGSGTMYGFRVCVDINSQNRSGEYFGPRTHLFLILNDRVVASEGGYSNGSTEAKQLTDVCTNMK